MQRNPVIRFACSARVRSARTRLHGRLVTSPRLLTPNHPLPPTTPTRHVSWHTALELRHAQAEVSEGSWRSLPPMRLKFLKIESPCWRDQRCAYPAAAQSPCIQPCPAAQLCC
jgi:hypothetical protein